MYLGLFDDTPKKATSTKINEGIAAYVERYKTRPDVVLVNERDLVEVKGVAVRVPSAAEGHVARNMFWIGVEGRRR